MFVQFKFLFVTRILKKKNWLQLKVCIYGGGGRKGHEVRCRGKVEPGLLGNRKLPSRTAAAAVSVPFVLQKLLLLVSSTSDSFLRSSMVPDPTAGWLPNDPGSLSSLQSTSASS